MTKFSNADFHGDIVLKLGVITAHKCGLHPLTKFRDCPSKPKYNRMLNEYVNSLGEDWEATITRDFNTIINEEVMNENFDPANIQVAGLSTTKTLLLTPEQYEVDKDTPAFQEDQGFKMEIVEKTEMFFSPTNIENEPELPKDGETENKCEAPIHVQSCSGSEQQPEELQCKPDL